MNPNVPTSVGHKDYSGCLILTQQHPHQLNGGLFEKCRRNEGFNGNPVTSNDQSICEYTECGTTSGKFCEFPFKYKGRLYDTCITLDDKGSEPGDAWCSTAVDHITRDHTPGIVCQSYFSASS